MWHLIYIFCFGCKEKPQGNQIGQPDFHLGALYVNSHTCTTCNFNNSHNSNPHNLMFCKIPSCNENKMQLYFQKIMNVNLNVIFKLVF